jgi:protein-disulfide isomerase
MAKRKRQQQRGAARTTTAQSAAATTAQTKTDSTNLQSRSGSRRAQRVVQQQQQRRKRLITYVGGAVVAAVVVVGLLILFSRDTGNSAADAPITDPPPVEADVPVDGRAMGNADAPVTLVEYGDFQCPGCGQFARSIESDIVENYVKTGQVVFEYRDFAFLGDESLDAAEAARCAQDQGKFWEMHHMLFYNQEGENQGAFSRGRLDDMAERVGLNMDEYTTCMDSNTHAEAVELSTQGGSSAGVVSTPSFLVNGELLSGVNNYDAIASAIDQALSGQ